MSGASGGRIGRRLRGMVGTGAQGQHFDDAREGVEADDLKLAGFYVGRALYGIDIMRIKEVIQARPYPVRHVPHAPVIVEGVIQLRGVVIPVIDLRKRFRSPIDASLDRLNKLIIVSVRGRIVGLKVDRIVGELRVPGGALRPAPSMLRAGDGGEDDPEFFSGVSRVDDDMVFVVNLETVIDPGRGVTTGGVAYGIPLAPTGQAVPPTVQPEPGPRTAAAETTAAEPEPSEVPPQ